MAKNGNCKHDGIMKMTVIETKKHEERAVRIRRCRICGARVKTVEVTETVRFAERQFAQQEMRRLTDELRANVQMTKGAKEAMMILQRFAGRGDNE